MNDEEQLGGKQPFAEKIEKIMSSFPFKAHVPREGEPPMPNFSSYHLPPEFPRGLWLPDVVFYDKAYKAALRTYFDWAVRQPDGKLLAEDLIQRQDWFAAPEGERAHELGEVTWEREEGELDVGEWHRKRWELAEDIRHNGKGELLDKYWPNNSELHHPPIPSE